MLKLICAGGRIEPRTRERALLVKSNYQSVDYEADKGISIDLVLC